MSTSGDSLDATISTFIQREDLTESQRNELVLLLLKKGKHQTEELAGRVTFVTQRFAEIDSRLESMSSADTLAGDQAAKFEKRLRGLEDAIEAITQAGKTARNYVHATWATLCAIATVLTWLVSQGVISINGG